MQNHNPVGIVQQGNAIKEYMYVLTEDEHMMIRRHRADVIWQKELSEKRKICQHDWKYDGHSHNDDCYVCRLCGETEYR